MSNSGSSRQLSPLDQFIAGLDKALRVTTTDAPSPQRENPAGDEADVEFSPAEVKHVAGLMRINHAGEVCAQALYSGQAATARNPAVRLEMQKAAMEEVDHLAWCESRLHELNASPSKLNALWYGGSWALGAIAGAVGDRWSLGFLMETERQVEAHLEEHANMIPARDKRTQAILKQMKIDEAQHASMAEHAGAAELPGAVRSMMRVTAGLMKKLAYRF